MRCASSGQSGSSSSSQIGIEVAFWVLIGTGWRRDAADESVALWADPHARRVEHERHGGPVERRADHEDCALARLDRQRNAGERGDATGGGAGSDHHVVRCHTLAVRSAHSGGAACDDIERHSLVVAVACATLDRVGADCAQQTVGVEPALVLQTQRGTGQTLRVQPREMRSEPVGIEHRDVGTFGQLHIAVGTQRRLAVGAGQNEIGAADEADALGHRLEKRSAEQRHPHVERQRELSADRGGGQRCGRDTDRSGPSPAR